MNDIPDFFEGFKLVREKEFDYRVVDPKQCEVFVTTMHPGQTVPDHSHDSPVANFVTRGTFTVHINDESRTYQPGEWVEIKKGVTHSVTSGSEGAGLIEFWHSGD